MADIETNVTEVTETEDTSKKVSLEERLAQLEVDNKKLKSALDKASSETAEWKKKWRGMQDEKELAALDKAEKDAQLQEELNALKRENTISKFSKSFMGLGYSEEMAEKAAIAQFDGDTDTLFKIQKQFDEERVASIKADLMKNMPTPPTGTESFTKVSSKNPKDMSFDDFVNLKASDPEAFSKLNK